MEGRRDVRRISRRSRGVGSRLLGLRVLRLCTSLFRLLDFSDGSCSIVDTILTAESGEDSRWFTCCPGAEADGGNVDGLAVGDFHGEGRRERHL